MKTVVAAALATLLVAGTAISNPAPAEARDRAGPAIVGGVFGLATGLILGGALNGGHHGGYREPGYGYEPTYAPAYRAPAYGYQGYDDGDGNGYRQPARVQYRSQHQVRCWTERVITDEGYTVRRKTCERPE